MSTPTPLDSKIITLIVAMFDAAPGAEVLAELRSALTAGESVENLARNLVRTQVFQSLYPDTLGSAEFAARFAQNVLGEEVGFDQQAFATVELTAMQLAGLDRGQVVLRAIEALLAVEPTNPEWGNARRAFENKVIVAEYYSVEKGMSAQTLEALQTVLAPVTSSDRSTLSAIRIIDGLPPLPALTISGTITAGPVVADNGLTVTALSADGQVLGSSVVDANGNYSIALPSAYTGVVLLRVTDSNDRADYVDEATGEAMDLNIDLRAVAVADGRSDLVVNVTPATELVALGLGLAAGDNGNSSTALQGVTALQVASTQTAVQQALGLPENFVSAPVIPAVTAAGEPNAQANLYGNVLAAISGLSITQGRPVGGVLATLSPQVSSGKVSQVTAVDMVGAAVLANANGAAVGSALGMADNQANQVTTAWTNVFSDTTVLSTSDLTALGIPVSDNAQSAAQAVALVSSALRTTTTDSAARSVSVLTGLTTAADNVVAAVNGSAVLTLTDLQTLGVRGITEAQVASVAQALTTLGVDRLPTTADELNTVAQQAVTVDGPNVDRTAPVFPDGAGKTVSVAENADTSTVVYDAQATDNGGAADAGITYRLSGTDAAAFAISTAGVVTLNASADFETKARYAIEVIATDATGNATTQTVTINVINVNDAPSGTPSISGTVTEDQTLTAVTTGIDDADGLGAFSYQWLRDGSAISGATSATYTLGDADVGKVVSVRVDYTDARGTAETLTSAATAAVANVNDAPSGTLTIDGTAEENSTLTAVTSGIDDADGLGSFSYQWLREGSAISGATNATYTLGDADVGKVVSVRVDYTDARGTAETLTSAATAAVANVNDAPSGTLTIDGTAEENSTLTAVTSGIDDADGLGAFSYQWLRDGSAISGATSATYTLGDSDVGKAISSEVSYTDGNGTRETLTSTATAAVANVNDAPNGTPGISGAVAENSTLTAVTTGIADADGLGSFSYQWLRGETDIDGATGETYTLGNADIGQNIRVRVNYTDGNGTAESVLSTATAVVTNVNDAPIGRPGITGTVAENSTLTAVTTDITDADGMDEVTFSYQWVRGSTDIDGATGSSYLLTSADIGQTIRVRVSYTDGRGTLETLGSDPTAPVADVFNPVIDTLRVATDNIVNGSEQSTTVDGATYQAITGQVRGTLDFDFKAGDRIVALVGGEGGTSVEGTVSADGSFSINVATTVLRDAAAKTVAVTLFSTGSGNTTETADASASTAYSVDLVAPTLTVASTLATDTGMAETIANGGLTKDRTVVLSGTATDTGLGVAKVLVYDGTTLLGETTPNATSGSWTFTTAALSDGTHTLTAEAVDSAGNRSTASAAFSFTVDATGPTITTEATAYVLENASALLVPTGTDAHSFSWSLVAKEGDDFDKLHLEPGSIPDVRLKTGNLDYESGKTAYQFTLRATDAAGNATDKDFTVNVLDVPEVTVGDLRFGDGTDAVVNIAERAGASITLSGKITATGSYQSAQIAIYPVDGDQPLDQPVLVNPDGTFSVELDTELVLNDPGSVLAWTVTLEFVDSQGVTHTNVQTSGESGYVVDTTAPDASLASLSVTPDNTINAIEMTAAQAGEKVTVTGTVGGTDFTVGDTVTLTVNAQSFTGSVLDETGRFSIEVDGSAIVAAAGADRSVTITVSDAAGNTDDATTTFVVDITGPAISTAATQRVDEGSGNLLYTAAASDAGGGTVTFSLLGTDAELLNVGSDGRITLKGAATLDHETQDSYSFTLRASDSVGNHTDQDVTVTVVNVPEFGIASATLAGDNVINLAESTPPAGGQARVSVVGQLSGEFAGARVYADGDGMDPYETTVATDGSFEISLPVGELTAQTTRQVQLEARVVYTNAAGNTVPAVVNLVLPYSIDTSAPAGNLQGISLATDNILNDAESTATSVLLSGSVSGEFTVGNTVKVTVGTSVVDGTLDANGHFSIPVNTTALLEATIDGTGSLSIEVLATDAAGNSAPYTQTLSYTVDTTAPVVSAIAVAYSDATDTSATVSGSVSGATAGATVLLQVFTEAGDAVGEALPTTLGDGGSFSVALPTSLAAGSYRVQATVQDAAGNTAQPSSDLFTHNPLSVAEGSNTGTAVEDGDPHTGSLSLSALNGSTPAAAAEGSYAGRLGTLAVGAGNAWTYTLNAEAQKLGQGVEDIDTISVNLTDGRSINFALTVRGVNDAPTADDAQVDDVEEGATYGFDLPSASDPDTGDTPIYTLATQALHGTVEIGNADVVYTPTTPDYFGQDSFTYTVSDGNGGSNTYTVTLNIANDGETPVVSVSETDTLTVTAGTPVAVALEVTELVGNVSWSISEASASGFRMEDNFLVGSAPAFADLTPVEGSAYRQVNITVVAEDERQQSVTKVITLWVADTNSTPTVTAALSSEVNEGAAAYTLNLLTGASDLDDGETATLSVLGTSVRYAVDGGTAGTTVPAGLSLTGSVLSVDPTDAAYNHLKFGASTTIVVSYDIKDAQDATVAQTQTIIIKGTNDTPTVTALTNSEVDEGAAAYTLNLLTGASDLDDGETATLSVLGTSVRYAVDGGTAGTTVPAGLSLTGSVLSVDPTDAAYNHLKFGASTTIVVSYDIKDAQDATVAQTQTINIKGTNDAPQPTPQTVSGSEDDTSITGNLLFAEAESPYPFDPDGDALLVSRIVFGSGSPVDLEGSTRQSLSGTYGNLSIGADGEFEYTPDDRADALAGGATASEIFTYTVVDSHGATGSSTFTVALTGVNDAPIAVNDTNVATEAGGTSTASTGVVNAAGNVITGRRGAIGSTSFAGTDSDPDSTTLTVASFRSTIASTEQSAGATTGGSHGRLTLNGTGEYTYSPYTNTGTSVDIPTTNALEAGATSTDSFTYTLSDGSSTSTATLVITVTGSDDAIFLSGTGTRSSVSAESGSGPVALDDSGDSLDDITLTAWELSDQNSANAWTYTVSIGATDRHASDTLTMSWEGGTDPNGIFDAVWNASTFVLTVTPKSGVSAEAALAHRDRVFAAVQFETSDEATTGERTISYAVKAAESAGGLLSNTVTQTVDVTNDSGILASGSGSTPENVAYDTTLSLTGATGTVTWTKLAGEDSERFSLDNNVLTLAAQDFESPADIDSNNVYRVRVQVQGVDSGSAGTVTGWISVQVTNANDAPAGLPSISGTVTEDQTLSAVTSGISDADGLGDFSYQWLRDGSAISGASGDSYTLGDAEVGKAISVRVSYTDAGGTAETLTSAATSSVANVNDAPVGLPTISGTATEDQTLTADTGDISDADGLGTFSYQWLRGGADISGATSSTYVLGDSDVGTTISVKVSYTDGHLTAETRTSASTTTVSNIPDAPTMTAASFSANSAPGPLEHSTTPISVSMSGLFAALSPADVDGNLSGLKVNSLVSGTLTVDGTNYTSAASVPTLTAASTVTWTPGTSNDLNGLATAFTVRAVDGTSLTSTNVGNVQFNLTNVNDAPVMSQVTVTSNWTGISSQAVPVTFAAIRDAAVAQGILSDGDGLSDIVAFRVTAVNTAADFRVGGVRYYNDTTTPNVRSTNVLINETTTASFTLAGTGVQSMFRVIAVDNSVATSNANISSNWSAAALLRVDLSATKGTALPVTAEEDGSAALAISDGLDPWANGGTDGSVQLAAEEALVGIAGWQTVGTFSDMAG